MSLLISLFVGSFIFCVVIEARIEDTVSVSAKNANFSASEINRSKLKSVFEKNGYKIKEIQEKSRVNGGKEFNDTVIILSKPKAPCSEAPKEISAMKAQLLKAVKAQESADKISAVFNHLQADLKKENTNGRLCQTSVKLLFKDALHNADGYERSKRFFGRRRRRRRRSSRRRRTSTSTTTTTTTTTSTTVIVTTTTTTTTTTTSSSG